MSQHADSGTLHERIRQIRREAYGDEGVATLAKALKLPPRTWENYEAGVVVPASVLLGFILSTGVEPRWLLTGEGERYSLRAGSDDLRASN